MGLNHCPCGYVGYSVSGPAVIAVAWNGGVNNDYQWALSGTN